MKMYWKVRKRIVSQTIDLKFLYLNHMSKSKFIVLAYPFACFSGKISRTDSVQNDFSLNNIEQKDIRRSPLSNGETRRSLALAVLQLLKLRQPLFNSGADISDLAQNEKRWNNAFSKFSAFSVYTRVKPLHPTYVYNFYKKE
jgi:hypothetical protein